MRPNYPRLSADDEIELAAQRDAGDVSARDKLVLANLKLVRYLARRLMRATTIRDDVIAAGDLGLVLAADDFDPVKHPGVRFGTWATWHIRGEIIAWLQGEQLVHTPLYLRSPTASDRAQTERSQRNLKVNLRKAVAAGRSPCHFKLDGYCDEPGNGGVVEPEELRHTDAEQASHTAEAIEDMEVVLNTLSPLQYAVIAYSFGLDRSPDAPQTQRAACQRLGMCRRRYKEIEVGAIKDLRRAIRKDRNHCVFHQDGKPATANTCA